MEWLTDAFFSQDMAVKAAVKGFEQWQTVNDHGGLVDKTKSDAISQEGEGDTSESFTLNEEPVSTTDDPSDEELQSYEDEDLLTLMNSLEDNRISSGVDHSSGICKQCWVVPEIVFYSFHVLF